eukprot:sb/3473204/
MEMTQQLSRRDLGMYWGGRRHRYQVDLQIKNWRMNLHHSLVQRLNRSGRLSLRNRRGMQMRNQCLRWYMEDVRLISLRKSRLVLKELSSKTCDLDPIPTWIVKDCLEELAPIPTEIVNKSLKRVCVPDTLQGALVMPTRTVIRTYCQTTDRYRT